MFLGREIGSEKPECASSMGSLSHEETKRPKCMPAPGTQASLPFLCTGLVVSS